MCWTICAGSSKSMRALSDLTHFGLMASKFGGCRWKIRRTYALCEVWKRYYVDLACHEYFPFGFIERASHICGTHWSVGTYRSLVQFPEIGISGSSRETQTHGRCSQRHRVLGHQISLHCLD